MAQGWSKYPQSRERFAVVGALRTLGETTQHEDRGVRHRTFRRSFRAVHALAKPVLQRFEDLEERYASLWEGSLSERVKRRKRWRGVGVFVEAWYRRGVFAASPMPEEVSGVEVVRPDPDKSAPYHAVRAYGMLTTEALGLLIDAASYESDEHARDAYTGAYLFLRALTVPLLARLEGLRAKVVANEGRASAQDPGPMWDNVPFLVEALYDSEVLGASSAPVDTSGDNPFLGDL